MEKSDLRVATVSNRKELARATLPVSFSKILWEPIDLLRAIRKAVVRTSKACQIRPKATDQCCVPILA